MTALPTLKLRVLPTFPSAVLGSGPITVTKTGGIFTFGFDVALLGIQTPPAVDAPTDFVIVYDSVNDIVFRTALSAIPVVAKTQRSVTATPIVVAAGDQIINCNINADATCALPTAASRNGIPLTFKDLGHAAVHNITITPNGAERIDGLANIVLRNNFQAVTLTPFNDGTNSGWFIT